MFCPNCNQKNEDNVMFCGKCGYKIRRCPTCGTVINNKQQKFCLKDGTPIPGDYDTEVQSASVEKEEVEKAAEEKTVVIPVEEIRKMPIETPVEEPQSISATSVMEETSPIPAKEIKKVPRPESKMTMQKRYCLNCGSLCAVDQQLCDNCRNNKDEKRVTEFQKEKKEPKKKRSVVPIIIAFMISLVVFAGGVVFYVGKKMDLFAFGTKATEAERQTEDEEKKIETEDESETAETEETSEEKTEEETEEETEKETKEASKEETKEETEEETKEAKTDSDEVSKDITSELSGMLTSGSAIEPTSGADFITFTDYDGDFSFVYPKNYYNSAFYEKYADGGKRYTFSADDGSFFYIVKGKNEARDPIQAASEYVDGLRSLFIERSDSPYIRKSTELSSQGLARGIITGVLSNNDDMAKYYLAAFSDSGQYYEFVCCYKADSPSGCGADFTVQGYVLDSLYRGLSFGGTSYKIRSIYQYMEDELGEKK